MRIAGAASCKLRGGASYVHAERAIRSIAPDSVEVISVHTEWRVSSLANVVDIRTIHSSVMMSGSGRDDDVRTTEFRERIKLEYTIDPNSCEMKLGDSWCKNIHATWFRFRGDISAAEIERTDSSLEIRDEETNRVFVVKGEHCRDDSCVWNQVRPESGHMCAFSVKVVDGTIQIGGPSGIVLGDHGPESVDMPTILNNYRTGINEGYFEYEHVRAVLGRREFASMSLMGDRVPCSLRCSAGRLKGGTDYVYDARMIRSKPRGEIVSIHIRMTTHASPNMVDVEILARRVSIWFDLTPSFTETNYVSIESVPISVQEGKLVMSGPWVADWDPVEYVITGYPSAEHVLRPNLSQGKQTYLLNLVNQIQPGDGKMVTFGTTVVDGNICVGDRYASIHLKPAARKRAPTALQRLRDLYRAGIDLEDIPGLLQVARVGKPQDWHSLPLVTASVVGKCGSVSVYAWTGLLMVSLICIVVFCV